MRRLFQSLAALPLLAAVALSAQAQVPPLEVARPDKLLRIVDKLAAPPATRPSAQADLTAYLLVYFKDETHDIYFATSPD